MIRTLKTILRDATLRNRILFVLAGFLLFRILANVPIPGIDPNAVAQFVGDNQFLGLLNIFSGGGLSSLSIVMLGVGPYITASIIMQLVTIMSPKIKAMYQEEGEAGRRKFSQYSRLLTVPLAIVQGFGFLMLLSNNGIITGLTGFETMMNVIIITAGSMLLTWIGELISEFGIGNGMSLIIFAGIVASLPTTLSQLQFTFTADQLPTYIGFALAALLVTLGVVVVTEAERPVPITYSKEIRGGGGSRNSVQSYLPLRVNQAGVIPIIFALSILLFPQMIIGFLANTVTNPTMLGVFESILTFLNNGWVYAGIYFILVFGFTYFYTAITFEPENVAKNLQRNGAFVPGVRPGRATAEYLDRVVSRLTLFGATFLALVAVLPLAMQALTGVAAFTIGGTSLLIAVSVVIDLIKKIEAQTAMREY